jgi:hypothetical protein
MQYCDSATNTIQHTQYSTTLHTRLCYEHTAEIAYSRQSKRQRERERERDRESVIIGFIVAERATGVISIRRIEEIYCSARSNLLGLLGLGSSSEQSLAGTLVGKTLVAGELGVHLYTKPGETEAHQRISTLNNLLVE